MNFSRRAFIKIGGIAAVTSLGLPSFAFAQTEADVLLKQTSKTLRQLIGTEFYFTNDEIYTAAKLTNVKDFPHKTPGGECFSIEFQVPLKRIKEGTYRVWHNDIGTFDLFLTDSSNGKIKTLVATINRI